MAVGYALALGAALCWAVAVVLFKRSSERLDALSLNVFKTSIGLGLLGLSGAALGFPGASPHLRDWLALLGSGALGIGLADTLLFAGLARIGAARQAIVDALYSPSVVLLSWGLLGERLGLRACVGGGLILAALVLASSSSSGDLPISRRRFTTGVLYSALAVVLMAAAIVAVKPVIERSGLLWCTTVRVTGGLAAMGARALATRDTRRRLRAVFRPNPTWRDTLPATLMGSYFSLLMWIGAFKFAPAGVAALLNQTSTLFIVLLSVLLLGEPMTARLALAVTLACAGSLTVLL
jgi:drug/metabolite transporter (DMT)-like permease